MENIEDYDNKCKSCKRPVLIHAGIQACTRSETVGDEEYHIVWREFRTRMKNVMKSVKLRMLNKFKEGSRLCSRLPTGCL